MRPPTHLRIPLDGLVPQFAPGDLVEAGRPIAISAPTDQFERRRHSPFTGEIIEVADAIVIEGVVAPSRPVSAKPESVVTTARLAGLVGMGGAMFPTYAKLAGEEPVDCVIVNGCESEPYVTCDHRVLVEQRAEVEGGMQIAMSAVGATRGVIADGETGYVDGEESRLVQRVLGRVVPWGKRPRSVGALVVNVQTVRSLYRAMNDGHPLVERIITVDGGAVGRPGNYRVPIGTEVGHILAECHTDLDRAEAIILGGPMMGQAAELTDPVVAGTIAVLALGSEEITKPQDGPCIGCGRCMEVCPSGLPAIHLTQNPSSELSRCTECGACQFACPSHCELVGMLRKAKARLQNSTRGAG
ncbi:MAG TPA: 4Fe-4S dicluster domain-containing protein [Planctomycetota bacterium]|nr:4Fe-4S dicluster domain-containing protein [Planctomycetota bacterium]